MKLVRWTRFTWNLATLPPIAKALDKRYCIRVAARDEEAAVAGVILRAFSMDSEWADYHLEFRDRLQLQVHHAFERESVPALVILHGVRIVAASALTVEVEAESNLLSGPCVLAEYCNRGIGSALLHESLVQLAHAGLARAHGISKDHTLASRFVYSKFGSTHSDHESQSPTVSS
jgi:predicted N-acetyltransferase YhbS